jgi:hypothetical protein
MTMNRIVMALGTMMLTAACSSSSSSGGATAIGADSGTGTAAKGQIGDACPNGSGDCADGLLCDGDDPHGQCFKECAPSVDADCGDVTRFACNFEGHCYTVCKTTADCPRASEGYVCKVDEPDRACGLFCDAAD